MLREITLNHPGKLHGCLQLLPRDAGLGDTGVVASRIVAFSIHWSNYTASAVSERYRVTPVNSTGAPQACQNRRPLFWLMPSLREGIARPRFDYTGTQQTLLAGGMLTSWILNLIQSFSMRILGWLLLLCGLLLCVSVLWAAPGFVCMGLGLIFLQIAEQKRRSAKSAASPYDQSELWAGQAPIPEAASAINAPETDEDAGAGRENVTGPYSYNRQEWCELLRSDADILRLAKVLESYGQKYVDEFAAAYLAVNDKDYLPMILQRIVASARRDGGQNIAGDFHDENANPDPVAIAVNRTRRIDRVREMRAGYAEKIAYADNAPKTGAGPENARASRPSGRQSGGDADMSAARGAAAEPPNRKAPAADAESNPVEETSPEPPEAADAAVGEKKGEGDAVDAGNLTGILDRLSEELIPKTK